MNNFSYIEQHCTRCGKEFICHNNEWAYRSGPGNSARLFCSWKCLQAWRQEKPRKRERQERIRQAIADGLNPREICRLLNEEPSVVRYWWNKVKAEENEDEKEEAEKAD
jgi:DNA invertase Pin-like site-specific DNA recombinase